MSFTEERAGSSEPRKVKALIVRPTPRLFRQYHRPPQRPDSSSHIRSAAEHDSERAQCYDLLICGCCILWRGHVCEGNACLLWHDIYREKESKATRNHETQGKSSVLEPHIVSAGKDSDVWVVSNVHTVIVGMTSEAMNTELYRQERSKTEDKGQ